MVKSSVVTVDVLRAIRLMLHKPDTTQDSKNVVFYRKRAPAVEGWYLPRDFTKPRSSGENRIPKACSDTATTRLRTRLLDWGVVEERLAPSKDVRGRIVKVRPVFLRLRTDPEGTRLIDQVVSLGGQLHFLGRLPGIKPSDLTKDGELSVREEWYARIRRGGPEADALNSEAKEKLYAAYRYHALKTLTLEHLPRFQQRLSEELSSKEFHILLTEAIENYSQLESMEVTGRGKRSRPEKSGGD